MDKTSPLLSRLLEGYPVRRHHGPLDVEISSVVNDSRKAEGNSLFVAIHGYQINGDRFITDAINRGARAIVTESSLDESKEWNPENQNLTAIQVENGRHALAWISKEFYRNPSGRMHLVGITGTNGKTTLTYILETIYRTAELPAGVIGTINYRYGGTVIPASTTTPESLDINRMLDEMVRKKIIHCFLEISSHSLSLNRVDGMAFEVAVFSNLSRDHLDFHKTLEQYKETKKSLFHDYEVKKQVLNIDDETGREIMKETSRPTLTTGIDHLADIMAEDVALSPQGSQFTLNTPMGSRKVDTRLLGKHNIYNALSAVATALHQNISLDDIVRGLQSVKKIPGRFERLDHGQPFTVVVDYAHTDDAMRNVLQAAKALARKKIIAVFGCGGDRDHGKRKEMGRVALELSDYAIITSDNPRSEDPQSIIDEIGEGIPLQAKENLDYIMIANREDAIEHAIHTAKAGDMVLILGKGHEDYQILKNETIHFDDREIAAEVLRRMQSID